MTMHQVTSLKTASIAESHRSCTPLVNANYNIGIPLILLILYRRQRIQLHSMLGRMAAHRLGAPPRHPRSSAGHTSARRPAAGLQLAVRRLEAARDVGVRDHQHRHLVAAQQHHLHICGRNSSLRTSSTSTDIIQLHQHACTDDTTWHTKRKKSSSSGKHLLGHRGVQLVQRLHHVAPVQDGAPLLVHLVEDEVPEQL